MTNIESVIANQCKKNFCINGYLSFTNAQDQLTIYIPITMIMYYAQCAKE